MKQRNQRETDLPQIQIIPNLSQSVEDSAESYAEILRREFARRRVKEMGRKRSYPVNFELTF